MLLQALAEARALLHEVGEFTYEEATDPLYCYAIESGLAAELGIARVRDIIEAEFATLDLQGYLDERYREAGIDPDNLNPDGSDFHLMNAIDDEVMGK
jgi:hypothetical protein